MAYVFWTHGIFNRKEGWLSDGFHRHFREVLLHTCSRYRLACPAYCLMPDHWHCLLIGCHPASDQALGTAFLRKYLAPVLVLARLQDRAHDHVLREEERKKDAVLKTCLYIRENPVRKELVKEWEA